jgi:predicted ferric reductase
MTTWLSTPDEPAVGPALLLIVAAGNVVLWVAERPAGSPTGRFIGELCGAEAVLLFSCSLVLAALVPWGERAFGGLDRVFVWHRRVAVTGLALLVPHVLLVTSAPDPFETSFGHGLGDVALLGLLGLSLWALAPRLRGARWPGPIRMLARTSHEHWLNAHRLTGLFVAVALTHGAIVAPTLRHSTSIRLAFIVTGSIGLLAYIYRELLARFVVPNYGYEVASVRRLSPSVLEIGLDPVHGALSFAPGQFIVLAIGGTAGWEEHPFTVSSSSTATRLDVTIKASGDYTDRLYADLQPGAPARVTGPFGGFDYHDGRYEQVWIAGGIGVTPFISWLRSLNGGLDRDVDFYYTVKQPEDAVYLDEIDRAAARYPTLRPHVLYSARDGLLTADDVMGNLRPAVAPSIYMCGPRAMATSLSHGFERFGVPRADIHWEEFDAR